MVELLGILIACVCFVAAYSSCTCWTAPDVVRLMPSGS